VPPHAYYLAVPFPVPLPAPLPAPLPPTLPVVLLPVVLAAVRRCPFVVAVAVAVVVVVGLAVVVVVVFAAAVVVVTGRVAFAGCFACAPLALALAEGVATGRAGRGACCRWGMTRFPLRRSAMASRVSQNSALSISSPVVTSGSLNSVLLCQQPSHHFGGNHDPRFVFWSGKLTFTRVRPTAGRHHDPPRLPRLFRYKPQRPGLVSAKLVFWVHDIMDFPLKHPILPRLIQVTAAAWGSLHAEWRQASKEAEHQSARDFETDGKSESVVRSPVVVGFPLLGLDHGFDRLVPGPVSIQLTKQVLPQTG
jgi:hypothetical protein